MECEFFTPGARIIFTNTHRVVDMEVGALPAQIQFQIGVKLTAFDAGGAVLSTATTAVSSNGMRKRLSVKAPTQSIASVVLESSGAQVLGVFGLLSVSFDNVTTSPPDFVLTGRLSRGGRLGFRGRTA